MPFAIQEEGRGIMKVDIFNTDKKYNIIYADPAWQYNFGATSSRFVNRKYTVMSKEDICRLPVGDICADDAVLLMWITFPKLDWALDVIKAWGFEYKTNAFTWIKQNKKNDSLFWGMGYYTRSNAEICLLATKGNTLPRMSHKVHSVIMSHIEEHSKKPHETRERIVELFGNIPRIELFARQHADGWDCWGNEV